MELSVCMVRVPKYSQRVFAAGGKIVTTLMKLISFSKKLFNDLILRSGASSLAKGVCRGTASFDNTFQKK